MNHSELEKRAKTLRLNALTLAAGMKSGTFKSLYRGHGMEFSGVREYLRGDDVRAIDWNVSARMSRPFVKMFEEERELDVFLVVDDSFSMGTGGGRQSKLETAIDAASIITLASEKNSSPVGAVIFDGIINFSCAPKRGAEQSLILLSQFERMRSKTERSNGSALDSALKGAWKLLKKRSLVIIISDFRTEGWASPLAKLAQKNDVVAVRVTDRQDSELPRIGSVKFKDPETGTLSVLPTSDARFSRQWRESDERRVQAWQKECIRRSAVPLEISTDEDAASSLIHFFNERKMA